MIEKNESPEALSALELKKLCSEYMDGVNSVTFQVNQQINDFLNRELTNYSRAQLKDLFQKISKIYLRLENYNRVFFYRVNNESTMAHKATAKEFFANSSLYLNRLSTIINQVNNQLSQKEARFALIMAYVGIGITVVLSILPFIIDFTKLRNEILADEVKIESFQNQNRSLKLYDDSLKQMIIKLENQASNLRKPVKPTQ